MLAPILVALALYGALRAALGAWRSLRRLALTLPRRNADFGLE